MHAARLCWTAAALILVAGLVWGISMSAAGDHSTASAHAHFNLTGWVTLALYGTYYALNSAAGTTRLALGQAVLGITGSLVLSAGIAWLLTGGPHGLAVVGAIIVLTAAVLFAVIVFVKPLRRSAA